MSMSLEKCLHSPNSVYGNVSSAAVCFPEIRPLSDIRRDEWCGHYHGQFVPPPSQQCKGSRPLPASITARCWTLSTVVEKEGLGVELLPYIVCF